MTEDGELMEQSRKCQKEEGSDLSVHMPSGGREGQRRRNYESSAGYVEAKVEKLCLPRAVRKNREDEEERK